MYSISKIIRWLQRVIMKSHKEFPHPFLNALFKQLCSFTFYQGKHQLPGEGILGCVGFCFLLMWNVFSRFWEYAHYQHDPKCFINVRHTVHDPLKLNVILGAQLFISLVPHHLHHSSVRKLPKVLPSCLVLGFYSTIHFLSFSHLPFLMAFPSTRESRVLWE